MANTVTCTSRIDIDLAIFDFQLVSWDTPDNFAHMSCVGCHAHNRNDFKNILWCFNGWHACEGLKMYAKVNGKCQCHAQTRVAILYLIRYTWKVWSMEIEISKLFSAWLMFSFCALIVNIVSNWLHCNYIILVCCLSYLHISIRITSFGFQKT